MNVAAGTYLSPSQKIAWLRLIRTPNVGPQTFRQLINRTGSAEAAIDALPSLASRVGVGAAIPSVSEAEDEIAALQKLGGRLVASGEPDYPPLLAHITPAPPLLSIIGGERLDLRRTVAIVVGFAGILVAIRPGAGEVHPAVLLSLAGMLCYAVFSLVTRFLAPFDRPEVLEFINAVNDFKSVRQKPFPTWSEIFDIFVGLGYRRLRKE